MLVLPALATAHPAWDLAILAERIGKLHAQQAQGIVAERSRRGLAEAMRQFEATLPAATAAAPPDERENYVLLRLLWREYRPWLARPATRDNARRLAERSEELAWVAMKAARAASAHDQGSSRAAESQEAGVLAQRVARLHLLRRWDVRDEAASRELTAAAARLRRLMDARRADAANTPEAAAELDVAHNQLLFMERAAEELAARPASPSALDIVARTGDHILESMGRVARLYEGAQLNAARR